MPIQKITISEFLDLAKINLLLDVRSPSEYAHAHIPKAKNLPLFNDEERKIVGTNYKQQSREDAIKIGLDFFGTKMRSLVETVEQLLAENKKETSKTVLIHCWRGGMRSAGVAWLLDLYGFKVYTLVGGYKTFRNYITEQFAMPYNFNIIGGYTGSGKTYIIEALKKAGKATLDLEGLANHKGSALGAIGMPKQPTQEMFENLLGLELVANEITETTFLEDESQRIGLVMIPNPLWINMRKSKVFFIDIPFEERLNYLVVEYGSLKKEELVNAGIRIQKRLGGLETKNYINFLLENNFKEAFSILLKYYDKHYTKGLHIRENAKELINFIQAEKVNANASLLLLQKYIS